MSHQHALPRPPQVALPTSTITIKPHDDETAPNLPNLRIQVFPKGLVVNSPPLSSRPDTKALAHALKVFVPLNGKLHIKISLDLCSLGDHQSLRLRDEAIQTLDSCLRDNACRVGLERITRCPEPRISASEEDDVDLHYRVLPKAALPEHEWFKQQMVASQEPYIHLKEIRLRMSWSKAPNGAPRGSAAIDHPGSYLDAVHRQLRCGMRRTLRLQFIQQFPLVFDDSFIQRYKITLRTPATLIHSLRSFVSLAAQHDTPLFTATRDLLDDIEETQDMMLRRQVEASVKVAPKRGPKKRKVEGSTSDAGDDGHMDIVANHLRRLGRRDDALAESSISRALMTIGVSEWSCVRRGQSKAGAGRIILENTPVPNTNPYDDIRNHTGESRVPSPLHDNKYKPALIPTHAFGLTVPTYQHQNHPSDRYESAMCEPQRNTYPFSDLLPLSPVSRASLPPPAPRSRCVQLPVLDDDLDFEYDSPEAECASSMGHIYIEDWSSSLSSHDETEELSAGLSAVELDFETSSVSNALCLDLHAGSSTFAFDSASDDFSDIGSGSGQPYVSVPVALPTQPFSPTPTHLLGDSELSDDLSQLTVDSDAPESSRRRRGRDGSAVPRVMSGPCISVMDEYRIKQPLETTPAFPAPFQRSLSDGHSTDEWASDWDIDMSPAPFEDDLADESDATERDELSPPGLDEDSDLESDGPSIDSPQESGVLMSGVDPRSKHQGSEPSQFTQIVDDLDFDDEVLVTPMEEDTPYSLTPVAV